MADPNQNRTPQPKTLRGVKSTRLNLAWADFAFRPAINKVNLRPPKSKPGARPHPRRRA